ncbi:MAG: FtsX-like permease family protein [Aggregatilineales bacterium]
MFYLRYAARNVWRSRRWSAFAIFSIAAGVAAIVALRSLGLAIGDSLTSNVRASNHGDITLSRLSAASFISFEAPNQASVFTPSAYATVREWVAGRGGQLSAYISSSAVQITALESAAAGRPQFISTYFIDPATYPPTQDIRAQDPPGAPLGELFQGGNDVVISENLAATQGIKVGDRVRVSGTTDEYVVRGIVPATAEAGLRNLFAAFFGFAYLPFDHAPKLSLNPNPNTISIALPEGTDVEAAANELSDLVRSPSDGLVLIYHVPQILRQNAQIADVIGRFVVVMGLGALLIGGVGIVNTMLVMMRRRTEEIAALKTFGLKGRQVALMFIAEALILGLVGSLVGGALGVILAAGANAYGEALIQQPLAFRIYPDAILFGLVLGLVTAAVFGVLPVLTAIRIRPSIILRPNETHVPRAGALSSIGALLLVLLAVGLIAGQILGNTLAGVIGVAVTLLILGLLVVLLWVVVWVVGRLPSFGSVDLRLALRNLRARRLRTATTLMAISAGMFALSSISFVGAGTREILQLTLSGSLGGNVLIFPILPPALANPLIDRRLDQLEGVNSRTRIFTFTGSVTAINNRPVDDARANAQRRAIINALRSASRAGDLGRIQQLNAELYQLPNYNLDITMRDTTGDNFGGANVTAGRPLQASDRGRLVAVLTEAPWHAEAGLGVGSQLTVEVDRRSYTFEVVGVTPPSDGVGALRSYTFEVVGVTPPSDGVGALRNSLEAFSDMQVPPGALPVSAGSSFQFTLADVRPEALNTVLLELSAIPLVFSIDFTFIDSLLRRFIDQFSALPILVGLLSLGAAAVIMANTVALATLERRRQIGILKAIGLKGQRVLGVMLLENVIVSLLGALLGIGLSALGVVLMSYFGLELVILIPQDSLPVALALVAAAALIGAVATVLSAQVAIRERALNVLRYE